MIVTIALKTHRHIFSFFSCRSDLRHHCECTSGQRSAWCPVPAQSSVLCFMQLHHQTTAITGASLRRCGTTAGFVMLTNTFLCTLFVVSVGTPGRLSLHRVTVHIWRGLRCWQGGFLHLFWCCRSFVSAVRYFVSIHTCRSCHFQS